MLMTWFPHGLKIINNVITGRYSIARSRVCVGMRLGNETLATFYHFEITDPDGLEALLHLPPERELAPIALFDGGEAAHYLTLSVFEAGSPAGGMRAQWAVYTDDGSGRPPHMLVIETMTEHVDFDPATILNLPSGVQHRVDGGAITTTLSSPTIRFQASFETAAATEQALSLDWIEAGDRVCSRTGVCRQALVRPGCRSRAVAVQRPGGPDPHHQRHRVAGRT